MQVSFDDIQSAFVQGDITLDHLVEILTDNFGPEKAFEIMVHNVQLALKKAAKYDDTSQLQ